MTAQHAVRPPKMDIRECVVSIVEKGVHMATEKRLIDASEVEELFYKQVEWGATDLMDAFDDALDDAQTVDAVEVVRCRDCMYWESGKDYEPYCNHVACGMWATMPDDFCSYGETRTDD
jgi:hypothetical protein